MPRTIGEVNKHHINDYLYVIHLYEATQHRRHAFVECLDLPVYTDSAPLGLRIRISEVIPRLPLRWDFGVINRGVNNP